jgi:urea carboxylase
LQIHFDSAVLDQLDLLHQLQQAETQLPDVKMQVPSRTVYLPLAWEDSQTQLATERYTKRSVLMRRGVLIISSLFVALMA